MLGFWSGDEIRLKALRWKRSGWLVTVELPEGGSEDKKRKHTVEFQKSLIQFLIATVPAIVLYFIGWAYLYFYFSSFGINIAEIHLDTSTVFIYAFSPLAIVVKAYWPWIAPLTVIIVAVVLIITTLMPRKSRNEIKQIYRWVRDKVPIGVTTLLMIIGLLIFLSALVPVVKWAAIQQRKQVWAGERPVSMVVLVEGSKPKAEADPAQVRESYMQCSDQQALLSIFSDDKAYYLLCKSVENSDVGYVFEVRREFGLSSVRFVSAGGQE